MSADKNISYSIIVVCLNSGKRLIDTIDSIMCQDYKDYEIVVKDGGSSDNSLKELNDKYCKEESLHVYTEKDSGIYDAMNQAVKYAKGDYILFLNTGDSFYDEHVLANATENIKRLLCENGKLPDIVYGNLYHKALDSTVFSSPVMNDFTCYRNVPCHQTCIYSKAMFDERAYEPKYNVRADYEHFLYCFYEKKADIRYIPVMVAAYEGGGYSETKENLEKSARQHREIVVHYMGKKKANHYRRVMILTLAPLRKKLAESDTFSKVYNKVKELIYKRK